MRPLIILASIVLISFAGTRAADEPPAGVGLQLQKEKGHLVVGKILPESPAAASGDLHEHDVILAVAEANAEPVKVDEISSAVTLMRGKKGTTVKLTVIPAGKAESEAHVVVIVRAPFKALENAGDGKLLAAGSDAPDAAFTRLSDGEADRLSNYRGKVVVLVFWATWCGPCQDHMANLQSFPDKHPEWKDKVVLIAASIDDRKQDATAHVNKKGWDKTTNVWAAKNVIWAYHFTGIPTTYVIGATGKIVAADPVDPEAAVRSGRGKGAGHRSRNRLVLQTFRDWAQ